MKKTMIIFILELLMIEILFPMKGFRFEHITSTAGLTDNSIRCILQDRQGFMWFGCAGGYNRSLSDNTIWSMIEDKAGLLIYHWHLLRMKKQAARLKTETLLERFFIRHGISTRERDVILLILQGKSNREIEDQLFISLGTVKNHIYAIFQKLNINSRVQLVNLINDIRADSE